MGESRIKGMEMRREVERIAQAMSEKQLLEFFDLIMQARIRQARREQLEASGLARLLEAAER